MIVLNIHSNAFYLSKQLAWNLTGGSYFLLDDKIEHSNKCAILNISQIIQIVM